MFLYIIQIVRGIYIYDSVISGNSLKYFIILEWFIEVLLFKFREEVYQANDQF